MKISAQKELTEKSSDKVTIELYSELLEAFGQAAALTAPSGNIIFWNKRAEQVYGWRADEAIARNIVELIQPKISGNQLNKIIVDLRRRRNWRSCVVMQRHKNRDWFSAEVVSIPLFGRHQELIGVINLAEAYNGERTNRKSSLQKNDSAELTLEAIRRDLDAAKQNYEALLEELRLSNEDIQQANEELQASEKNLRDVNKELINANDDLADKISEIANISFDLQNLVAATDIATIFLDKELRIKRFTPRVESLFNIIDLDIGRPLSDFTHKIQYENLGTDAAHVLKTGSAFEKEVFDYAGRSYLARFLPYRTPETGIQGIVLNFIDITDRKKAEHHLLRSAELDAFRIALSDALRALAEPSEIQSKSSQLLGEYLNVSRAFFLEIIADEYLVKQNFHAPNMSPIIGRFKAPDYGKRLLENYRLGQTMSVPNIGTDHRFTRKERTSYLDIQTAAFIGVPLVREGRNTFVLTVQQPEPRYWTAEEIELVRETAERTWLAVERACAEESLRVSENRQRIAIQVSKLASWDWNLVTDEIFWNEQHYQLFGMTPENKARRPEDFLSRVHPDDKERIHQSLMYAIESKTAYEAEFHIVRDDDGSARAMHGYGYVVEYINGIAVRMTGVMRDITDRLNSEKTIREKEILQKLVGAQEEERKRIARDLHDDLGQQLVLLRRSVAEVKDLYIGDFELSQKIFNIESLAKRIDDGVDFLSWELRPATLDHLGLYSALGKYVAEWSRYTGIEAEFLSISLENVRLPPDVEINLYRIAQEALNNISKHAKARYAGVSFEKVDGQILLLIEDNGIGFNAQMNIDKALNLGIIGMRERTSLIGGSFTVEFAIGRGTTVYIRLPAQVVKQKKIYDVR